jgi:hypothetical protein
MKLKLNWRQKLADSKDFPRVQKIEGKMSTRWGRGTFVIPAPIEVDQIMRTIRKGRLITFVQIREFLARRHNATIACPVTTGIFALIAARAAEEDEADGKKRITPYWRTLKANGEVNPKFPGGLDALRVRLESEGHVVSQRGKRMFVASYEKKLATLK